MKLLKEKKGKAGVELIYKLEWSDQFQYQELNRINQLALPMLLPASYCLTPMGGRLHYHAEGMISLTDLQPQIPNLLALLELVRRLTNALIHFGGTSENSLKRLEYYPQHVFFDMRTGRVGFVYCPVQQVRDVSSPLELFYGLGLRYDCKNGEGECWNAYLSFLREHGLPLEKFNDFLTELMEQTSEQMNGRATGRMTSGQGGKMSEGGTVLLTRQMGISEENQTICLLSPILLHQSRQKKIMLEQLPFAIGRVQQYCDYVVNDSTVSKRHIVFYRNSEGAMVVQDNDSLNGTWVNGTKLEATQVWELKNGDRIQIGCESFLYNG